MIDERAGGASRGPLGRQPRGVSIAVDTSSLVAIVLGEPDHERHLRRLKESAKVLISTVSVVEAKMVVYGRRGAPGVALLDSLLRLPVFEQVAPDADTSLIAYEAFVAFGKGTGHPAGLNFGDVFAHALARSRSVPLLFKGNDFSQTDIEPALSHDA